MGNVVSEIISGIGVGVSFGDHGVNAGITYNSHRCYTFYGDENSSSWDDVLQNEREKSRREREELEQQWEEEKRLREEEKQEKIQKIEHPIIGLAEGIVSKRRTEELNSFTTNTSDMNLLAAPGYSTVAILDRETRNFLQPIATHKPPPNNQDDAEKGLAMELGKFRRNKELTEFFSQKKTDFNKLIPATNSAEKFYLNAPEDTLNPNNSDFLQDGLNILDYLPTKVNIPVSEGLTIPINVGSLIKLETRRENENIREMHNTEVDISKSRHMLSSSSSSSSSNCLGKNDICRLEKAGKIANLMDKSNLFTADDIFSAPKKVASSSITSTDLLRAAEKTVCTTIATAKHAGKSTAGNCTLVAVDLLGPDAVVGKLMEHINCTMPESQIAKTNILDNASCISGINLSVDSSEVALGAEKFFEVNFIDNQLPDNSDILRKCLPGQP
ncbi:hypothetical protein [unidentified bacterial endosymbiont]|uniref:hypothetical protein n=1 Tax=unidentified bacterial endosymbiont TaxID=2355 RepID=UPI00209F945B|nr:hypothetical protein [unidentified bacterial endosymbiont]